MQWPWQPLVQPYEDWLEAGVTLGLTFLIAFLIRLTLKFLLTREGVRDKDWARAAGKPLRVLVFWGLILKGASVALRQFDRLGLNEELTKMVDRAVVISWTALFVYCAVRFASSLFDIAERKSGLGGEPAQLDRMGVARKIVIGATISIGLLFALREGGLDISPLLAGGAIGGIIFGLALQESLSNVFAGFLMNLDSSVRVGELIRMNSGEEGFIERVGWRTTTIRLWEEALLVVPNSAMSKQIILNLSRPAQPYVINLQCGVAYGSELEAVEKLVLELAKGVQQEYAEDAELSPPYFRWREFGDSAVLFKIFVPIADSRAQYKAKSSLVKAVHSTLLKEGVEIPFPMRTVTVRTEADVLTES